VGGAAFAVVHDFCKPLSVCSRTHSFAEDDRWWKVFCFAQADHARMFRERFGGRDFDPAALGRGHSWHLLKKPKIASRR
jgi:hypothetical protein